MLTYKFKFRRRLFWKTRVVTGHRYEAVIDKIVLYYPDGSLEEIPCWRKYRLRLGVDWLQAERRAKEQQTGVSIPVLGT